MLTTNYFHKRLIIQIPLVAMLIFSMFLLSFGVNESDVVIRQIILSLLNTATIWLGCMVIVQYLWKKYPWEQFPVKHLLLEIAAILIYTMTVSWIIYLVSIHLWNMPIVEDTAQAILMTLLITFLITAIHEGAFFYQQWKYNFSKSVRLERDNIEARYEALRSQVNPHFLFNSLNSLVSLVEDNKAAVEYIRNLSELLRYMLKSSEKELVLLREELAVLKNYMSLQLMRFRENLQINLEIGEGSYHYALPPLALQMLVENAIKHNVITREKPLRIDIGVEKDFIVVKNNLQKKDIISSTQQGLKNIKGRYRLFTTRSVNIDESNGTFKVSLPLLQVEL